VAEAESPVELARLTSLVAAALVLAAGCGGSDGRFAGPQVVRLGWHENCGTQADALPIETRRLVQTKTRWRLDLSFRNETRVGLNVIRPHFPGGTKFGLDVFRTTSPAEVRRRAELGRTTPDLLADRFRPRKPELLAPGDRWTGSFSGPGRLPAGVPIRVVLGRFFPLGSVPPGLYRGFICISEKAVRLR
jgi:hypothetical protein